MPESRLPDLAAYFEAWREDVELLRQNALLSESRLLSFARDRGVAVRGVVAGDPGAFHERGWLKADGHDNAGTPLFHPFRLLPLHKLCEAYRKQMAFCAGSNEEAAAESARRFVNEWLPSADAFHEPSVHWNTIADMCVLLEPLYWPGIVGKRTMPLMTEEAEYWQRYMAYRQRVLALLASQDMELWQKAHESVRVFAGLLDKNERLYLLLRASVWSERERITGTVSGAMWLRHMGEVVRRGFEEADGVTWPEEDQAFGWWRPGGRSMAFGAERPLDELQESRRYMARRYGLHSGSYVRWYLEGETEHAAVERALPEADATGIELMNLHGAIAVNRDNAVLRLHDMLRIDRDHKRFSFLSFDTDVTAVVKSIRRLVADDAIVGYIDASSPDFELANFTGDELLAIALHLETDLELPVERLLCEDWGSVSSARDFRDRFASIVGRPPMGFKGQSWGRALAEYALEYPAFDNGRERPFIAAVRAALRTRKVMYDQQRERFCFDPQTFETVERREG